MMYSILGAVAADRKSSSDAKLPRNELVKIGLFNAMENEAPLFSMISAKMSAEDKIKVASKDAEIARLSAELQNYKALVSGMYKLSMGGANPVPPPDSDVYAKFGESMNSSKLTVTITP